MQNYFLLEKHGFSFTYSHDGLCWNCIDGKFSTILVTIICTCNSIYSEHCTYIFLAYPEESNVTIHATCRPNTHHPAKVFNKSSTTITTSTPLSSTSIPPTDPNFILSHEIQKQNQSDTVSESQPDEDSNTETDTDDPINGDWVGDINISEEHYEPTLDRETSVSEVEGVIIHSDGNIILGNGETVEENNHFQNETMKVHSKVITGNMLPDNPFEVATERVNQMGSVHNHYMYSTTFSTTPRHQGKQMVHNNRMSEQGIQGASFIVETISAKTRKPAHGTPDEPSAKDNRPGNVTARTHFIVVSDSSLQPL